MPHLSTLLPLLLLLLLLFRRSRQFVSVMNVNQHYKSARMKVFGAVSVFLAITHRNTYGAIDDARMQSCCIELESFKNK